MRLAKLHGVHRGVVLSVCLGTASCADPDLGTAPQTADGGVLEDGAVVSPLPTVPTSPPTPDGSAPPPPGPPVPLGQPQQGEATYYAADGSGNCSFEASPSDLLVAALNLTDYAGSATCGACIEVKGPSGTVNVRVVDSCPGCKKGDVDLSKQAFEKIAALSKGRVPISWSIVACPVPGPVAYRIKEGSSKFYTAIQVRNHKVPVAKLEYEKAGVFIDIPRKTYNYFVADKGVGDQPNGLKVRVTASNGATLVDTLPATITPAAVIPGKAQFP
jgi:expansin